MRNEDDIIVCKVKDLKPYDQVLHDQTLGSVSSAETLTVKSAHQADFGKYAVTFFGVGTIFVHGSITIEVLPSEREDAAVE